MDGIRAADPLADAVVDDFAALPPGLGMTMFRVAAQSGIDTVADAPRRGASPAAHGVLRDRARRGVAHRGSMNSTAGMPLVMTGRYTSQAAVRSLEVGAWLETILTPAACAATARDSP